MLISYIAATFGIWPKWEYLAMARDQRQPVGAVWRRDLLVGLTFLLSIEGVAYALPPNQVQVDIMVDLPGTSSGKAVGGIDDCEFANFPITNTVVTTNCGNESSSGNNGVRTTIPSGDFKPIPLLQYYPLHHFGNLLSINPKLVVDDLAKRESYYADARAILALSSRLFLRGLIIKPPAFYAPKTVTISVIVLKGATLYDVNNASAMPIPLSTVPVSGSTGNPTITIHLPSATLYQETPNPNQYNDLKAQMLLLTEAEEVLALSEQLYQEAL